MVTRKYIMHELVFIVAGFYFFVMIKRLVYILHI